MKTKAFENVSKVEPFENGSFWNRSAFSEVKTDRFENAPFQLWVGVVSISVFGRCSIDDRRKLVKKYAFSYENGLMWAGENKTKILCLTLSLRRKRIPYFKKRSSVLGAFHVNRSLFENSDWQSFVGFPSSATNQKSRYTQALRGPYKLNFWLAVEWEIFPLFIFLLEIHIQTYLCFSCLLPAWVHWDA